MENDIRIITHKNSPALVAVTNSSKTIDNSVTKIIIDIKDKQGEIASWGPKNDYPQQVIKAVKMNGSASSGLRFLRKAHYGNGFILMKKTVDDTGKKSPAMVEVSDYPDIDDFFKKSQMKRFWKEVISDLEWFGIAFPEYVLSNDGNTINRVKRQRTAWTRFMTMDLATGLIESVFISEKFGKGGTPPPELMAEVPFIDSYWSADEVKEHCKKKKITNFIRPVFYPLLDEAYYPESEWHAILKSGWLDVANSVPELKKALFKNQMTLKFIIEIDEQYFENLYKDDWLRMKPDKRKEIRNGVIDAINESLVGSDKAGKSIQSMLYTGNDGKQRSAVKITPIDDKLKDGSYLPEAEAANSEVLFALGVDPSLIGAGIPGGKLGAGSGSDKREAFTILSALYKSNRETSLEIFEFIQDYNGWDPTLVPAFENTILTTLDANPTGFKSAIS